MAATAAARTISGLARAMVQHGLLSEHEADSIHGQTQAANICFVEQILLNKKMNSTQLAMFASRAFGAPLLDLNCFDLELINKEFVDAKMAVTRRVLPLHKRGNRLFVAVSDPANLQALDEVRFKTNLVIDPVVVEDDKLGHAIAKVLETAGQALKDLTVSESDLEVDLEEGNTKPSSDEANPDVEDAPVVRYIQKLLLDAIGSGVSDIHFEPYEKFYRVRYRIDGVLMEIAQPPLAIKDKVASRIKVISKLDIAERRVPQDGRMKLVLSILDSAGIRLGIDALGYDPDQQQQLLHAIGRPYGMILVTGPTGSGK